MLEKFDSLADAILELKKQNQLDAFANCCNFDSTYNIPDYSKAKLKAAIAGLDDSAYIAIDELRGLNDGN